MSMSSNVTGVRDLDGQFAKMMQAKLALEAAGVKSYPAELKAYFGIPSESEEYLRSEMESVDIKAAVKMCGGEMQEGWEVDLSKLPKEVKAIRFINSY